MAFQDLYDNFMALDESNRIKRGQKALHQLLEELKSKVYDDEKTAKILKGMIALFIGADNIIHIDEYQYFNDLFSACVTNEKFIKVMNKEIENNDIENVDSIIDNFSKEGKASACVIGLCFLTSDKSLTKEEKMIFEKIIS